MDNDNPDKHFDVPADKRDKVDLIRKALQADVKNFIDCATHAVEGAGDVSIVTNKHGTNYHFTRYVVCPAGLKAAIEHSESITRTLQDLRDLLEVKVDDQWLGNIGKP